MARKTAEEAGLDAATTQAQRDTEMAALAAQQHGARLQAAQAGGQAQVLSNGPIPEVKLAPPAGSPQIGEDADTRIERQFLDPNMVAPVVADATKRRPFRRAGSEMLSVDASDGDEAPREERWFVVLEDKKVLDATNGHRTTLRQGKVISDKHYNIVALLRQGAKLKKTKSPNVESGDTDQALIDALT